MPITFTKTKLSNGWLSNMASYPMRYRDRDFRSAEAAFQVSRFILPGVQHNSIIESIIEEIRVQRSPMVAKFAAKKYAEFMVIKPCSYEDLGNMEEILRLKIEQHPELKQKLLETGEEIIIEDVTARGSKGNNLFWGMMLKDGSWTGTNTLGNLWMKIRSSLR